ncbi:hypothetical protein ABWW58_09675 [Sporolactobacillus sp. STCC-11]|uniref:hypothetical protein n=1 Tax=Sporolactobacillus caesalpiniae TaxID=3230362 RepID=UPI0033929160
MRPINRHYEANNRQQVFLNTFAVPSAKARQRSENFKWSTDTLFIFVDASELNSSGIFGLASCFVGQGEVIVKSRKHYAQLFKKQNSYAEYAAIWFAIQTLFAVIKQKHQKPDHVILFSDFVHPEDLTIVSAEKNRLNPIIEKIIFSKNTFLSLHPQIKLTFELMTKELKRHNPYYRAAHNASRKILH